ncbi:hypothetical protein DM860_010996 [Cuscuta australis]|uniref:Uncharacterized protein n=1 Tax=Cuscuta australis TaxID=267555 RepID=A0A328E0H2_9ASTE|nr:hypothetical protein DM860_010996 [Cuscuta australis]
MRKFPFPTPPGRSLHFFPNVSSPGPSPQISPSPVPTYEGAVTARPIYFFPFLHIVKGGFDFAAVSLIACVLFLSFLSLFFIIHLRLKSRRLPHLQNFSSLWTVRLLLVFFAISWAFNEVFRQLFIFPILTPLTLAQQTSLCKAHVVLSLGLFEPGFLVTLLFLVNFSIKNRNPTRMWALVAVSAVCAPILLLQTIVVFFSPAWLPRFFLRGSSVISTDAIGNKVVLCTYPTFSFIIFSAFATAYSLTFLLSCWKVGAFVINKTIGGRINMLAVSVMVALPMQVLCLSVTPVSLPGYLLHDCAVFAMLAAVSWCVAVGEVILVIKPIADALAAGGDYCRHTSPDSSVDDRRWDGL